VVLMQIWNSSQHSRLPESSAGYALLSAQRIEEMGSREDWLHDRGEGIERRRSWTDGMACVFRG
jgi:hypothetical protein